MTSGLHENLNKALEDMTSPIDKNLCDGIGSSSGHNFRQVWEFNDFPEEFYHPLDTMIQCSGVVTIENEFDDISARHENHNNGEASGEQDDPSNERKPYKRHTEEQIERLEGFFEHFRHPDVKQKKDLANELGLDPQQIKFWFQNKHAQIKIKNRKNSTIVLQEQNNRLEMENSFLSATQNNAQCSHCITLTENSKLKEKLREIKEQIAISEPNHYQLPLWGDIFGAMYPLEPSHELTNLYSKEKLIELVGFAMSEFAFFAQIDGENGSSWLYEQTDGMGSRIEVSRDTAVVKMSSNDIVKIIMDHRLWSTIFSSIVTRATTLEVLSSGDRGTYHKALHLMNAEFQVLSPILRPRHSCFLRYCKYHNDGSWTVTDISLDDNWQPNSTSVRCQRRPSGCLIKDLPDGSSKVTWVECVEVDDQDAPHPCTSFINYSLPFGAKSWISILKRHCELTSTIH